MVYFLVREALPDALNRWAAEKFTNEYIHSLLKLNNE